MRHHDAARHQPVRTLSQAEHRKANALAAFHVLWAATHGPASISLCRRLTAGEDADALARDVIDTAIAGLRAGVPLTFVPACPLATGFSNDVKESSHVVS